MEKLETNVTIILIHLLNQPPHIQYIVQMSNDDNFIFDPNLFMKLANINDEIENQNGYKSPELSFDVNEEELLV